MFNSPFLLTRGRHIGINSSRKKSWEISLESLYLHRFRTCKDFFRIQFKVWVLIFKVLYGMKPGYLRDNHSVIASAHPTRSGREEIFQIPLVLPLIDPKRQVFFTIVFTTWNILPNLLQSQVSSNINITEDYVNKSHIHTYKINNISYSHS